MGEIEWANLNNAIAFLANFGSSEFIREAPIILIWIAIEPQLPSFASSRSRSHTLTSRLANAEFSTV